MLPYPPHILTIYLSIHTITIFLFIRRMYTFSLGVKAISFDHSHILWCKSQTDFVSTCTVPLVEVLCMSRNR